MFGWDGEHAPWLDGRVRPMTCKTADGTLTVWVDRFLALIDQRHGEALRVVSLVVQVHGEGPWQVYYINPADDPRTGNRVQGLLKIAADA
jgi:hypothetical protein